MYEIVMEDAAQKRQTVIEGKDAKLLYEKGYVPFDCVPEDWRKYEDLIDFVDGKIYVIMNPLKGETADLTWETLKTWGVTVKL